MVGYILLGLLAFVVVVVLWLSITTSVWTNSREEREGAEPIAPLDDPYFGELECRKDGTGFGYWEGRKFFRPVGREVWFILQTGTEGPDQTHRDFFQQIEERYAMLLAEYGSGFDYGPDPEGVTGEQLFRSLELDYIELHFAPGAATQWEMVFTTELNEHIISLAYTDWMFESDRWDG